MFDVRLALTDMAKQLRACRAEDGLTLHQLASRCGVAASTIHKIEAQQMVPTVSVVLKIARGLGRRPEELVRDRFRDVGEPAVGARPIDRDGAGEDAGQGAAPIEPRVGAWRLDCARGNPLESITLDPGQRAILIIERGKGELASPGLGTRLALGECVEICGEPFTLSSDPADPITALLIVSPAGRLIEVLGQPNATPGLPPRAQPTPTRSPASTS